MTQSSAGRVPPHDLDAEAVVLAAAMLDRRIADLVVGRVQPEDFYAEANARIFGAVVALLRAGVTPDLATVGGWLRDREQLNGVGGRAYLVQLADETPAVSNLEPLLDRIRDKARVRSVIAECQRIAAEGYGDVGNVDEWLQGAEAAVASFAHASAGDDLISLRKAIAAVYERVASDDEPTDGIATGLPDLDRILGPLRPGQLVLIAAGSGIGKSALALNIGVDVATRDVRPFNGAIAFSAEMTREELAERALFGAARVDTKLINNRRRISREQWEKLTEAAKSIATEAFLIDDRADLSPLQIRATIRKVQAKWAKDGRVKLAIAIVDYVQLLNGKAGMPRDANREAEVNAIGRMLKTTAKECGIPIVALAQLNADATKRGKDPSEQRPQMSDMRESKALAMHADKIVLIHNPHAIERANAYRMGEKASEDLGAEVVDLIVGKNRGGGRTGTVQALFWPQFTLFTGREERDGYGSAAE